MIVDTSALVAVFRREDGFGPILNAMLTERAKMPTPAFVEFGRVTAMEGNTPHPQALALLSQLTAGDFQLEPFTAADADLTMAANERYGTGNGRGGPLNMLDLMVYGMAKRLDEPLLCTGRDFLSTDVAVHPASRRW